MELIIYKEYNRFEISKQEIEDALIERFKDFRISGVSHIRLGSPSYKGEPQKLWDSMYAIKFKIWQA